MIISAAAVSKGPEAIVVAEGGLSWLGEGERGLTPNTGPPGLASLTIGEQVLQEYRNPQLPTALPLLLPVEFQVLC